MKLPVPTNVAELFETLPLRFRADRAAGWNARFHFRFKDVARSDWTVVIEDGFCRTLEGHDGTRRLRRDDDGEDLPRASRAGSSRPRPRSSSGR